MMRSHQSVPKLSQATFAPVRNPLQPEQSSSPAHPAPVPPILHEALNIPVHPPPTVQPKLKLGTGGDQYEQEADRIAAQVVQQIHAPEPLTVQHQENPEEAEQLRMKPSGWGQGSAQSTSLPLDVESQLYQAQARGKPLSPTIRPAMEQAFGADFSSVRIHMDAEADRLNRSLSSHAFTTQHNIFFQQGAYEPESRSGQALIAHELTHVMQQTKGLLPASTAVIQCGKRKDSTLTQNTNKKQRPLTPEEKLTEIANQVRLIIDEGRDVPRVIQATPNPSRRFTTDSTQPYQAIAQPKGLITIRNTTQNPRATFKTDHNEYKVVLPIPWLNNPNHHQRPYIEGGATSTDRDNPFGRFDDKVDTLIHVDETKFDDQAISDLRTKLTNTPTKGATYTVLKKSQAVPGGYEQIESSPIGFDIWIKSAGKATIDFGNLTPQLNANVKTEAANLVAQQKVQSEMRNAKHKKVVVSKRQDINTMTGSLRVPDQSTVMKGAQANDVASPNEVAKKLGLPGNDWEWLHLVAHRFKANNVTQKEDNLILGTYETNSQMMQIEESVTQMVMNGGAQEAEFKVKATPIEPTVSWLVAQIEYKVNITYPPNKIVKLVQNFEPLKKLRPTKAGYITARELGKIMAP